MKKILFGLYVSIMLLGVTIDDVMAQIKVGLTMDKGGCALTGNGYLLNDPATNLPEGIKIGITLENVGGGPVIVTKGFTSEAFHLLLAFRGPDSQLIKSKQILFKGLPPSITKSEPPKEILVGGVPVQVDPVDILPANWIFSTTIPNAHAFYDLISAGSGVYLLDPIIPIRTYLEIIATIDGVDYAVLEPALFEGNVPNKGSSLEFCVIADEDVDGHSSPIAKFPPSDDPGGDPDSSFLRADCDDRPLGEDLIAGTIDDGFNINPGMTELPGDGLNNDCDHSTLDSVDICADLDGDGIPDTGRPAVLTMVYNGLDCSAESHSQSEGKVTCNDTNDPEVEPLPDSVYIVANNKVTWNHSQAYTYFAGFVNKYDNHFFPDRSNEMAVDIDGRASASGRLSGGLFVHIFDSDPAVDGILLQKVSFHPSCSEPLFTGNQFGSLLLFDWIGESDCCGDISEEDIALFALIESSINSRDLNDGEVEILGMTHKDPWKL